MRILQVLPVLDSTTGGGTVVAARAQCHELLSRGHAVEILAPWTGPMSPPPQLDGVPLHTVSGRMAGTRLRRWAKVRLGSFDLLHLHLGAETDDATATLVAQLATRAGLPVVVQTHGRFRPDLAGGRHLSGSPAATHALRSATWRLVADTGEREVVSRLVGTDDRVSVIQDGVRLPPLAPEWSAPDHHVLLSDEPPRRDAITGEPITGVDILAVTTVGPAKEAMAFADAAVAALELGVEATFSVLGPDGGDGQRLIKLVEENDHLEGLLRHLGPRTHEQTLARIAQADVVVIPARDGERSVVLMEALAAGTTVICTDATRHALTVRARDAAAVVRPRPGALAQMLVQLIDDPELRHDFRLRARVAAEELFDVRETVNILERDYGRALERDLVAPGVSVDENVSPTASARLQTLAGMDRLLWVSDDISHHRLAIWRQLAEICSLTVAVLDAQDEANLAAGASERFRLVRLRSTAKQGSRGLAVPEAPAALHALIRAQPDAMVLDALRSPTALAALSSARRHSVPVVSPGLSRAEATETHPSANDLLTLLPHQLPDAVSVDHLDRPTRTVNLRKGHRFLFIGALDEHCKVDNLLRAFAIAADTNDELVIGGHGPRRPELESLARDLELDDRVHFTGTLMKSHHDEALRHAYTVVLPFVDDVVDREFFAAQAEGRHIVASTARTVAMARAHDPNVFITSEESAALARALVASRSAWQRRISLPRVASAPKWLAHSE